MLYRTRNFARFISGCSTGCCFHRLSSGLDFVTWPEPDGARQAFGIMSSFPLYCLPCSGKLTPLEVYKYIHKVLQSLLSAAKIAIATKGNPCNLFTLVSVLSLF